MTGKLKKEAAVRIPLEVLRVLADKGWVVDSRGHVTPPDVGIRELGSINPVDILELPKIYHYDTEDIRVLNGSPCVILEVKKPGKTERAPGYIKVFNTGTGVIEDLPYEGTIEQIDEEDLRIRQETLDDVNAKVKEYNSLLSKIERSSKSVPTLNPQLGALITKIDERIKSLDGIIAAKKKEREEGGPPGTKELGIGLDEALNSGGLSLQDFVDTILYQYMYRYDELVKKLESNEIPMPASAEDPEALRQALINVARLAYQKYTTKLQSKKDMDAYKGRYQELIDAINNGTLDIPEGIDSAAYRASLLNKAENALKDKPKEIEDVELKELREMTLEQIPKASGKATGYQSIGGKGAYDKSLKRIIMGSERNKAYLEEAKSKIRELLDLLNRLEPGERSNAFLKETEKGREIVGQIRKTSNDILQFVQRYKMEVIDKDGNINPLSLGRKGSTGNAIVIVAFSKIYNTLSQILENLRTGVDVFEPEIEDEAVEDIADDTVLVPEPEPTSDLIPQSAAQDRIKQMSERLSQAFQGRTSLR